MGKFTKVNTLNSVIMEKHRNTPYRNRHPQPSFLSSCHLFRWTPNTCKHREGLSGYWEGGCSGYGALGWPRGRADPGGH